MKKLRVSILAALIVLVAANVLIRGATPPMGTSDLVSWAGDSSIPGELSTWLFRPGIYVLWYLGFNPDTVWELSAAGVIGWWTWLTVARLGWWRLGRSFGLINSASHHKWLLLAPPWRPLCGMLFRTLRWMKQFRFGKRATSAWTGALEAMTLVYKPADCVFLGRLWMCGLGGFQPIGIRGPRHITVIAASGSGKTRWLMAYLGMLHKRGSAFVIDCDGLMVSCLGPALERAGHRVLNLDPYRLSSFPGASWNALDEITRAAERHGKEASVRVAQTLAEALIQEENKLQPIFANSARVFIHGLILYVWLLEAEEDRNLVRVRDLLTRGMPERVIDPDQDPFSVLLSVMRQSTAYDDGCGGMIVSVIARAAGVMEAGKTRDGNPFRANAISATNWLDLPEIAAISRRSDFTSEDLKKSNPCVFICAPVTDIQRKLAGWVRALTMMTLETFQNMPGTLKIPCSFLLDEMPNLGRLEILETAAPVFRKYGVRLVVIAQDIERLRQAYPDSWGGFIGNAQCTVWMGSDHQETLEHLSKILGMATQQEKISGGVFSRVPDRIERRERPLMDPEQLRSFLDPSRGQIMVTRTGKTPLRIAYDGYDKALSVRDYLPDPNHREKLLRAISRRILNWARPIPPPVGGQVAGNTTQEAGRASA